GTEACPTHEDICAQDLTLISISITDTMSYYNSYYGGLGYGYGGFGSMGYGYGCGCGSFCRLGYDCGFGGYGGYEYGYSRPLSCGGYEFSTFY
ncbi:hypothetical protein A6R68_06166, partial [Neotoma lepida]